MLLSELAKKGEGLLGEFLLPSVGNLGIPVWLERAQRGPGKYERAALALIY